MTRRAEINCPREPIGLNRDEASAYIGVSTATFDALVVAGDMPDAFCARGRVLWDADEIKAAFRKLPRAGKGRPVIDASAWEDTHA